MSLRHLGLVPVLGLLPLLGAGCSDPPPPDPRGAFYLRYYSPSFETCAITSHEGRLGEVSESTHSRLYVDQTEGASISCTVSGKGPFTVSASASGATDGKSYGFTMSIPTIRSNATQAEPATGSVLFSSEATSFEVSNSASDEPCIFFFNTEGGQTMSTGKIWVSFLCPKMLLDQNVCTINEGYAIFENCDTGGEE